MKTIAITGSIGCGKTTIAKLISSLGYTVFDVDGWVRRLYSKPSFIKVIAENFPGVTENGTLNKRKLRNLVFDDNQKLKILESLIHPYLKDTLKKVRRQNAKCADFVFLDVALLFEMGWDKYCDLVLLADVDYEIQKKRVMERDHISAEDFDKINQVQLSREAKVLFADVIIDTNKPKNVLLVELLSIIDGMKD